MSALPLPDRRPFSHTAGTIAGALENFFSSIARSDVQDIEHSADEDLSVTVPSGMRGLLNHLSNAVIFLITQSFLPFKGFNTQAR